MKKTIQVILSLIIILLTAFCVYEVGANLQINTTTIKYSAISLASIIGIVLAAVKFFKRDLVAILLIPFIIIASGKGLALVAVTVFFLSNLGVGLFIARLFRPNRADDKISAYDIILSIFLGGGVNSFILWIALHSRVNYQFVYYLFFVSEIIIFKGTLIGCLSKVKDNIKGYRLSWGQIIILIYTAFTIVYTLVPWYVHDELVRHLYVPKSVSLFGRFDFDPHFAVALDTSIIPQSWYVATFLMGGEYAVRLINFLLFISGFIAIEQFVRNRFNSRIAFLTTLVTVTTPFLLWISGAVFIDSFNFFSTAILIIHLFRLSDSLTGRNIILYFVLCALAIISKQQAIFVLIPSAVVVAILSVNQIIKTKKTSVLLPLIVGVFLSLAIPLPVLLHNYIKSGNPILPFYNGIFKSPYFGPSNFAGSPFGVPLNCDAIYQITFNGSKFIQNHDFSFGITYFVFLALLPLVFLVRESRKYLKDLVIAVFLFVAFIILWWIITSPDMRYYIGNVFIGALILSLIIDAVLSFVEMKILKWLVISACAIIFALNLICQVSIVNFTSPYPLKEAFIHKYNKSNLLIYEQIKNVFDYASAKYGPRAKCFLANNPEKGMPLSYFADFKVESNLWYYYENSRIINPITAPKALIREIFSNKGFDFIITPKDPEYMLCSPEAQRYIAEEFSSGGVSLYVPKIIEKDLLSESFVSPISVAEPRPQVRLIPQISRGKGEGYKIIIEAAKTGEAAAMGRFQINWLDDKDGMAGVYIDLFRLTLSKEKYVSHVITDIPGNAVAGHLYLTSHDEKPILIYSFKLIKVGYEFASD